jgi:hypothetical protein
MPTWLKRILLGLLAILIVLPLSGALYQIIATIIDAHGFPPPGQMIDVGGYRLHLFCTGDNNAGTPTVILETGLAIRLHRPFNQQHPASCARRNPLFSRI